MIRQVFIQDPLCLPSTEGMGMTRRSVGVPPPIPLCNLLILSVENMSFQAPSPAAPPRALGPPKPAAVGTRENMMGSLPGTPQSAPTMALQSPLWPGWLHAAGMEGRRR